AHNDYDLATANVYASLKAGISGIHTTLNGLGERAGNVPLSSVIGIVQDHLHYELSINEKNLYRVSKFLESFSGIRIPANKPLIGENVFTQTSGIHADGDNKNNLYFNDLLPERFGRKRQYALGKMSGKASILKNLEELGIELTKQEMKKVTKRVIELGDKKETVTKEDLPYIISDVLRNEKIKQNIKIKNYSLSVAAGLRSMATLSIEINSKVYEETASGDGQYDAFMKALWKIYDQLGKSHPILTDYIVTIPPGGKTDALVECMITWDYKGKTFKTRGLDSDQTIAAIKGTIRMLNIIEEMDLGTIAKKIIA
ncbi:MAG: LeuA family protein, partial [Bacteroidota bacterium]